MKFLRSTLFATATAVAVAACGDKVTVAGPTTTTLTTIVTTTPTPPGKINSVTVTPSSATLTVGDQMTFTAAVNADAGLATTVTWASSDPTKVSVVATTGVATAVLATPGVSVCATSTVDTGKKGCGSVVVTSAPVTVPASVQIAGITTGNLNTPVDPTNVTGIISVQVNVNAGTQKVQRVVLLIGGVRADSQVLSSAAAAALRSASDEAVATQASLPTIVFTVNTAAFNATTGVPAYTNSTSKAISVELWTVSGTAAPVKSATASSAGNLTFNNVDALTATVTPVGAAGFTNATDILGFQWTKIPDSLDVKLLPVSYSGRAVTSIAMRPVCGDSVWTKVLTPFSVRYGVPTAGYQTTNSVGGCGASVQTNGEAPIFVSAIMTDGNGAPAFVLAPAAIASLSKRYDNVGPSAPVITQAVGISGTKLARAQGWLNDAAKLNTVRGSSSEGGTANYTGAAINTRGVDTGVGLNAASTDAQAATYKAYIGADLATALASTAITTTTGIAETAGQTLCLVVRASDALGNLSPAPTTCVFNSSTNTAASFVGIDRTAPSYARYQPRGADTLTGTYNKFAPDSLWAGQKIVVFAADTAAGPGLAGAAGIRGVFFSVTRTDNGATTCLYGNSTSCTTSTTGNITAISGQVMGAVTATDDYATAAQTANGLFVVSATAYDNAGNSLAVAARTVLFDGTAPSFATNVGLQAVHSGLQSGRVTISSDDNVDLAYNTVSNSFITATGPFTVPYNCARGDIKTTFGGTLVITDGRALTGCSAPAAVVLQTDTTTAATFVLGAPVDPTVSAPYLLQANGTVNLSDYAGNVTSAATSTALHALGTLPVAADILTAFGAQYAAATGLCPRTYTNAGFCSLSVSTSGSTTVFNGTGANAASTIDLRATVVVVDSLTMETASTIDSTVAQRKTAQLANLQSTLTASPFRSMTFVVYPAVVCTAAGVPVAGCTGLGTPSSVNGSSTGVPGIVLTGALDATATNNSVATGLMAETVDSITTTTRYVVSRTWRYVATFAPDKNFGLYTPILGRPSDVTATAGSARFYAVGNYSYPGTTAVQATTQRGAWALRSAGVANSSIVVGTTTRSDIGVLSPRSAAISVRR